MTWRVMAERCERCLFGHDPLVPNEKRAALLAQCRAEGRAFTCHKATQVGDNVSCRGFYDQVDSLLPELALLAKKLHEVAGEPSVTFVREEDLCSATP